MANPVVESEPGVLRLDFDRRLTLQSAVTSDADCSRIANLTTRLD